MPTKFKKFISSKHFSKLFLLFYVLFVCFTAYETNSSICLLSNKSHLCGAVYILFTVSAIMVMLQEKLQVKIKNRIYKKAIGFLSCFLICYFLILTVWEAISLIFKISGSVKAIGVITSLLTAILIVVYGFIRTKYIKTKSYEVILGNKNKVYKIVLISDLHLGVFVGVNHVRKMVDKINGLNPDIVVIAGDIFNGDNGLLEDSGQLKEISKQFRRIHSKEGVYAVVGNHDPKANNKAFKSFLSNAKIKLLNNDTKILSEINLIGRADDAHNIRTDMTDILLKADPDKPVVVLDHKPENILDAEKHDIDLVLCGHTHKGQFFPITIFTRLANGKEFFYGYYKHGKTHSIITSGVGFFELPARLGSNNEIVDIKITI